MGPNTIEYHAPLSYYIDVIIEDYEAVHVPLDIGQTCVFLDLPNFLYTIADRIRKIRCLGL